MSQIDSALLADLLRQAMKEGKSPFVTVVSNSMSPLIRRGDQIRIGPTTAEKLQPGDIIVYSGPANLITHRFWGFLSEKDTTQLVTKGDRPQHFDPPFIQTDLVGQVHWPPPKPTIIESFQWGRKMVEQSPGKSGKIRNSSFFQTPNIINARPSQVATS